MKRLICLYFVVAIILCMLFLFGCQNPNTEQKESIASAPEKNTVSQTEDSVNVPWTSMYLTTKLKSFYDADQAQPFDLPEAGLENVVVFQAIVEKKEISYYLLCSQPQEQVPYNAYLAVETAGSTYLYDLKIACYDQCMYVCDVDGDTTDEIIIQQTVGLAGGAGQYF